MKERIESPKKIVIKLLLSLIISAIFSTIFDCILAYFNIAFPIWTFAIVLLLIFAICFYVFRHGTLLWIFFTFFMLLLFITIKTIIHRNKSVYRDVDYGKEALYGGEHILLIVPHQDDDLNLLCGVFEEYKKYGSMVSIVYTTNGDFGGKEIGKDRLEEAINVGALYGVNEKNIYFLGYGDSMTEEGNVHLYNGEGDFLFISHAEQTKTYGLDWHKSYNDSMYTKNNFHDDLKSIILNQNADIIICVDYDTHIDHRAASLEFDSIMGEILKETDYSPVILKGFAYSTAWKATKDLFDSPNIIRTLKQDDMEYMTETNVYLWKDRIRLPINASTVSRSLPTSSVYRQMKGYWTQASEEETLGFQNGDKVFWERRTDSITYKANVSSTSGDYSKVNDFMLVDSNNIMDTNKLPVDSIWIPSKEDTEKRVDIEFPEGRDIKSIYLYDNPSMADNVLKAKITFDNNNSIITVPLEKNGSATIIEVDDLLVHKISIQLVTLEGENAGLSEVEIYENKPENNFKYIKLQDGNENFIYDYYMPINGKETFNLLNNVNDDPLQNNYFDVELDNKNCEVNLNNGVMEVSCPLYQRCVVTVKTRDGKFSDTVYIQTPGIITRLIWSIERFYAMRMYRNTNIYTIIMLLRAGLHNS